MQNMYWVRLGEASIYKEYVIDKRVSSICKDSLFLCLSTWTTDKTFAKNSSGLP